MVAALSALQNSLHCKARTLQEQTASNGAPHERRPDPQRNPRSQPVLPDAGPEPHPQRPRAGALPPRHQRGKRVADRSPEPGADDEDRRRQHPAVPLPHGRRHGLGPAHQPRQERRQRRHLAPARLDPARRPSPGSGLIMRSKSILTEAKQISRAVALIGLGARLQVLESETDLSYERLLRLYKEVAGKSPSKGQLPFSTDWFMTWQPNIHASLFLNIHEYLNKSSELDEIDAVIKGYQLYQEETSAQGLEALLSVTRAWRLVKFVDNGMLTMTKCSKCGGQFVTHPHEIARHYQCALCNPPARAGKGKAAGAIRMHWFSEFSGRRLKLPARPSK